MVSISLDSDARVSVFIEAGKPQKAERPFSIELHRNHLPSRSGRTKGCQVSRNFESEFWLFQIMRWVCFFSPKHCLHFHQAFRFRFRSWIYRKAGPWRPSTKHHWLGRSEIESEQVYLRCPSKCNERQKLSFASLATLILTFLVLWLLPWQSRQ